MENRPRRQTAIKHSVYVTTFTEQTRKTVGDEGIESNLGVGRRQVPVDLSKVRLEPIRIVVIAAIEGSVTTRTGSSPPS